MMGLKSLYLLGWFGFLKTGIDGFVSFAKNNEDIMEG